MKMKNAFIFILSIIAVFLVWRVFFETFLPVSLVSGSISETRTEEKLPLQSALEPISTSLPRQKTLATDYHIFQTFNNCAPAALSMALSYYGVRASQEELAEILRPNNNRTGKNDDKSTPPQELADEAERRGLLAYHRANGTIDMLKRFIAQGFPVVIRTLLEPGKDYAHYRVIKGYDDARKELIQDDSLQGKNLRYSYDDFLALWQPFNYAYLVLARLEDRGAVEAILGDERDQNIAWQGALQTATWELESSPGNLNAEFNTAVALYYLGRYADAVTAFEAVEARLPMRTLWYQMEPIQAYFELKNYARVFALSDRIFSDGNPAYAELYILRGKSYEARGDTARAEEEFRKAKLYHRNIF